MEKIEIVSWKYLVIGRARAQAQILYFIALALKSLEKDALSLTA